MTKRKFRRAGLWTTAVLALAVAACQTLPRIRTEMAPGADLARYHTYDYFEKPSTDRRGYMTITTRNIEDAIDREMSQRGLVRSSSNPDLKINFHIAQHDRVESRPGPSVGVGYGWGWRSRFGYDFMYGRDIETVTEGMLTIDLVDRAKNALVWSGSASRTLDSKVLDQPRRAIDQAVKLIFDKYPATPAGANASSGTGSAT
ncbi:MAG: DUF4136 domain-containing protein [Proteobacteria bacterium]|nr:DUF4136 domain-containing protein [Pseudomonadota bacterium]